MAIGIGVPLAIIAGYLYGLMLNRVKGQEMTVGNYFGYSVVSFMCIFWLVAPFKSPEMTWAMGGSGLRVTLSMASTMGGVLDNAFRFEVYPQWMPKVASKLFRNSTSRPIAYFRSIGSNRMDLFQEQTGNFYESSW